MSVVASSVLLGLAWFTVVNLGASAAACAAASFRAVRETHRSSFLLALRLAPAILSILFVAGVFLPAHAGLEQNNGDERFGAVIWLLAACGAAMLASSAWRVIRAVRVWREWQAAFCHAAERHAGHDIVTIPGLPGVSLAGLFRTTIIIGADVREALTSEELDVAVAHEAAHLRSRDNLKRLAMVAAPDVFRLTPMAAWVEQQWRAAVECAADAHAVGGDSARAVTLASALVKVARLSTPAMPSPVWSTFYEGALIEFRVRRLVAGAEPRHGGWMLPVVALGTTVMAIAAAWTSGLPAALHHFTETVVLLLS